MSLFYYRGTGVTLHTQWYYKVISSLKKHGSTVDCKVQCTCPVSSVPSFLLSSTMQTSSPTYHLLSSVESHIFRYSWIKNILLGVKDFVLVRTLADKKMRLFLLFVRMTFLFSFTTMY